MEFDDLSSEPSQPQPRPVLERIDCQYCEDSGLCQYCDRGRVAIEEFKKEEKKGKIK